MTTKTARYLPPDSQDDLILAWIRRARESQLAHYEMADILGKKGRWLGVPVILVTSAIGTSALASVAAELIPTWARVVTGVLSIFAAVLAGLQTFFNFADRADKHRVLGARYGTTRRKLEQVYARRDQTIDPQLLEILRQELDSLAQDALHIPRRVFDRVQKGLHYVGDGHGDGTVNGSGA